MLEMATALCIRSPEVLLFRAAAPRPCRRRYCHGAAYELPSQRCSASRSEILIGCRGVHAGPRVRGGRDIESRWRTEVHPAIPPIRAAVRAGGEEERRLRLP